MPRRLWQRSPKGPAFDVVVSDIELTGMGGAEFFRRVMADTPNTIRFALSGKHGCAQGASAASSITHQYLTKPFDPQLLHDLLARAFALRSQLADTHIAETLFKLGGLPALPRHLP